MNAKLQKITRDIERTRKKIVELEALLPELEKQKTEAENAEVIKAFRTAEITPAEFADFIKSFLAGGGPAGGGYATQARPLPKPAAKPDHMEVTDHE